MYAELHSRSAFSFLEGASLPEDMVGHAKELGLPAVALLDRDGLYGAPRFHMAADKAGVKAHIGAEVSCSPFSHTILSDFGRQSAKNSRSPRRHRDTEKTKRNCESLNSLSPDPIGN